MVVGERKSLSEIKEMARPYGKIACARSRELRGLRLLPGGRIGGRINFGP